MPLGRGLGAERGVLTGGATAICGASAALALSAALLALGVYPAPLIATARALGAMAP